MGSVRLGFDDAALVRHHDQLEAVAQVELLQDVRDVRLHRGVTDVEAAADLGVGQAECDEPPAGCASDDEESWAG